MMQAMNGYSGVGRRMRLLGISVALLVVAAIGVPQAASAAKPKEPKNVYLALGDSLAFGYSQKLFNENEKAGEPASAFEHGYVQDYFNTNNPKGSVALVNVGCPGETSASLIGNNKAFLEKLNTDAKGSIKEPILGEAPCEYHELGKYPLHHEYGGAGKSQLESALETITKATAEKKKIKAITLNIGPNDILHYVGAVEKKAGAEAAAIWAGEHPAEYAAEIKKAGEEAGGEWVAGHGAEYAAEVKKAGEEAGAEWVAGHGAEYAAEVTKAGEEAGGEWVAGHGAEYAAEEEKAGGEAFAEYKAAHETEVDQVYAEKYAEELANLKTPEEAEKAAEAAVVVYIESQPEFTANVAAKVEAYIAGQAEVVAKATAKVEAYIAAQPEVVAKATAKVEAFIAGQPEVVAKATKKVEAFLGANAEVVAKATAIALKEISTHYPELFGQILTNITGIVTELEKAAPKAKVTYQALYDPYGSLLEAGHELKSGFLTLAHIFNTDAAELLANKKTFKVCVTNPLSLFNPGGAMEPVRLQAFTNMANTEVFEGKKDGPDIHPTPLGYEVLALQMGADCKF